jgi:hypothetical protein
MGEERLGVDEAAVLARSLLESVDERWPHTVGVARQAECFRAKLTEEQSETLVVAAYLHDVGYAPSLVSTGFHALDGARFVQSLGHPQLAALVANHTGARFEAEERGLVEELEGHLGPDKVLLDALTYCDLTTSPHGEEVDAAARIQEILSRYPPGHTVHQAVERSRPSLLAAVGHSEELLSTGG